MALIRQSNAAVVARDAVVLDLGDLKRQGDLIRRRAREEAGRVLDEARAERERLIGTAAAEGRAEGYARGMEEGRRAGEEAGRAAAKAEFEERLSALERAWGAALEEFTVRRERMLVEARQEALTLALRIAALVVKRAVMVDPGGVAVAQAAEALRLLVRPTRAILAVHPDDRAVVADALPAMCARMAAAEHVELALDDTLERGSCVLRTAGGAEIEATVEGQLRRIAEALLPGQGGGTSSVPEVGP